MVINWKWPKLKQNATTTSTYKLQTHTHIQHKNKHTYNSPRETIVTDVLFGSFLERVWQHDKYNAHNIVNYCNKHGMHSLLCHFYKMLRCLRSSSFFSFFFQIFSYHHRIRYHNRFKGTYKINHRPVHLQIIFIISITSRKIKRMQINKRRYV